MKLVTPKRNDLSLLTRLELEFKKFPNFPVKPKIKRLITFHVYLCFKYWTKNSIKGKN